MTVELISVGTELLLGNIVNTNANYLSIQCAELGFSLFHQTVVGDNEGRLVDAIKTALARADILILTGGLGPTQDDLTKEATAKAMGRELKMDEHSKKRIQEYFNRAISPSNKGGLSKITENNWKQAFMIESCIVLDNENGTAPGYMVEENGKVVILLPGPPEEMKPMFHNSVLPYLRKLQDKVFVSAMVKVCGIGESKAETMLMDLIEGQTNPTIAPYAKSGEVHFRVTASAKTSEEAEALLKPILLELHQRFGDHIYSLKEEETLEEVIVFTLRDKGLTLTTAESCTGGLISGSIVNVPGSSEVFKEGFITYSNEAKMKYLKVSPQTLEQYGAVSEQTAREMAEGAALASGSDVAIAATGIAGPEGGTSDKPVGLVYIACYYSGKTIVKELRLRGNRQKIREQAVIKAMDLIRRSI